MVLADGLIAPVENLDVADICRLGRDPQNHPETIGEIGITCQVAAGFVPADRKQQFIGSFNWNQRSVNIDTELGVIIHSPELAVQLVERVTTILPQESFEVFLNEKNQLWWRGLNL